jgi:hypothetical protein
MDRWQVSSIHDFFAVFAPKSTETSNRAELAIITATGPNGTRPLKVSFVYSRAKEGLGRNTQD